MTFVQPLLTLAGCTDSCCVQLRPFGRPSTTAPAPADDACGVCGGPGAIYDCGCSDIPTGDCDCIGNQLDECGECGGPGHPRRRLRLQWRRNWMPRVSAVEAAPLHADCDGIVTTMTICVGTVDALGVCNGTCSADQDEDGICDDVDDCVGELDALGLCNGDCASDLIGSRRRLRSLPGYALLQTPCVDGFAGIYPCDQVDLMSPPRPPLPWAVVR